MSDPDDSAHVVSRPGVEESKTENHLRLMGEGEDEGGVLFLERGRLAQYQRLIRGDG
jgi:hypothetical protein